MLKKEIHIIIFSEKSILSQKYVLDFQLIQHVQCTLYTDSISPFLWTRFNRFPYLNFSVNVTIDKKPYPYCLSRESIVK